MEQDIFKAGVRPGSPASQDEIKMLVCYILSKIDSTIRFAQLHEALSSCSLVNYFDLVQVVEDLLHSGHIAIADDADGGYQATETGLQAAHEFAHTLPLSVREKAVRATGRELRRHRRLAEVSIKTTRVGDGYRMELSIPEQNDTLISFSLFLPTQEECALVRKRFLNDPVFIYQGVVALLTGNPDILGELKIENDPLF